MQGFNKIARPLILILQTIKLSKNLLLLMDIAESDEIDIDGGGDDCKDKTVKRLLFQNSNKIVRYLTLKARLAFI